MSSNCGIYDYCKIYNDRCTRSVLSNTKFIEDKSMEYNIINDVYQYPGSLDYHQYNFPINVLTPEHSKAYNDKDSNPYSKDRINSSFYKEVLGSKNIGKSVYNQQSKENYEGFYSDDIYARNREMDRNKSRNSKSKCGCKK